MSSPTLEDDVVYLRNEVAALKADLSVSERLRIAMRSHVTQTGVRFVWQ